MILERLSNKTVGEDGIASVTGSYMKAYTGGDRISDFSPIKEAGNKYYIHANRGNESYKYFRISREKAGITTGSITHNSTDEGGDGLGIYVIDRTQVID